MPFVWYEHHDTDAVDTAITGTRWMKRYHARGTQNVEQVIAEAYARTPTNLGNLIRSSVRPINEGGGVWIVEVTWENPSRNTDTAVGAPDITGRDPRGANGGGGGSGRETPITRDTELDPGVSFDMSAQQTKITQAVSTRWVVTDGRAQANLTPFGNAIGVSETGVEGCEIYAPSFTFTIPQRLARLTWGFIFTTNDITGKINEAPFYAFPEETCLYLGATGQQEGDKTWKLSHKFAYSRTEFNVEFAPQMVAPEVRGWDHVWVRYKQALVDGVLLPRPEAVYIQQVYRTADFSLLKLGG